MSQQHKWIDHHAVVAGVQSIFDVRMSGFFDFQIEDKYVISCETSSILKSSLCAISEDHTFQMQDRHMNKTGNADDDPKIGQKQM